MTILRKLLKVVLLPVFLLLIIIKLTLKLAEKASEIVVGFLILLTGLGIVFSLVTQEWINLLLFAIIGGAIIASMFACVVVGETCDEVMEKIRQL